MWHTREEAESKYAGVTFCGDRFYIGQDAHIGEGAVIELNAYIGDGAVIGQDAHIEQGAYIGRYAVIGHDVYIGKDADIGFGAIIGQSSVVGKGAHIGRDRLGVTACIHITGIGSAKRLTAHDSDDGLIIVIGCMNDYKGHNVEDASAEISKKYDENHEYFAALRFAEKWYENLKNANNKNQK